MTSDLMTNLYVFMLAAFIGFEVIRRVSPLLAHAADVAHQRPGRHRRGRRDRAGGRGQGRAHDRARRRWPSSPRPATSWAAS